MTANVAEIDRIVQAEDTLAVPLYRKRGIALVRGEGAYLWDQEGRRYLDMMSNYGVNILGHSHPAITAAITEQASTLLSCHQSFYSDRRASILARLATLLPEGLRHVSFANSGAEAVEAALKYARVATGRQRIIATKRSYHGRTLGALSVTGEARHRDPFGPLLPGCEHIPFGDVNAATELLPGAAAIILEPIQGESGVRVAPPEYLPALRRLCDQHDVLLILDEVQTAFRTGRTWAWQHNGVEPDIMTLSKPLANGLPIGLTILSDRVAAGVAVGSHGSTFGGNPLVCAAAEATLTIAGGAGFNERVSSVGETFLQGLRSIVHPLIREVRGVGLMIAVELKRSASPVLQELQAGGILAIPAGSTNVRFLPPLIVTEEQVGHTVDALELALRRVGDQSGTTRKESER